MIQTPGQLLRGLCLVSVAFCLPIKSAFAAVATPTDYGLTTPLPAPALPREMDAFAPLLLGEAGGPLVAEWTRTGSPDDTITLAGPDFSPATRFRFYGQTAQKAITLERAASAADGIAASVILPAQLPAWSTYLLWPQSGGRFRKTCRHQSHRCVVDRREQSCSRRGGFGLWPQFVQRQRHVCGVDLSQARRCRCRALDCADGG